MLTATRYHAFLTTDKSNVQLRVLVSACHGATLDRSTHCNCAETDECCSNPEAKPFHEKVGLRQQQKNDGKARFLSLVFFADFSWVGLALAGDFRRIQYYCH